MPKAAPATPLWHPSQWPSWLLVAFLYALAGLPMALSQKTGRGLGRFLYARLQSRAEVTRCNLALCFPELDPQAREQLAEDTFIACARGLLESCHAWWRDMRPYCETVHVEGENHLRAAQASGRGILLVGAHYSIFDFALPLIASRLRKPGYMYRPHGNRVIDRMIERGRRRHFGIRGFAKHELRDLISFLREGGEVWYACDQDYGQKSDLFAPFFGVPTACISTPSHIARESGAVVLCVSHLRLPDGSHRIAFAPVAANFGKDEMADACAWNRFIEQEVKAHPDQYFWLHKRFKTRPPGAPSVY